MAFEFVWLSKLCLLCGTTSLMMSVLCLIYCLYVNRFNLKSASNNDNRLSKLIRSKAINEFLYQVKAIVPNPQGARCDQIPNIQENKSGVKIAVIVNLWDKLISDNFIHSFERCLNLNGCDLIIQDATYKFYWYVYFNLILSIKSNRFEY